MVKLELTKTFDFKTGKVVDKSVSTRLQDLLRGGFHHGIGSYRSPGVFTTETDHSVILGGPSSTVCGGSGSPFIGYNTTINTYSDISTTSRLENQISLMEDAAEISETVSVGDNQDLEYLRSELTRTVRIPRSFTM